MASGRLRVRALAGALLALFLVPLAPLGALADDPAPAASNTPSAAPPPALPQPVTPQPVRNLRWQGLTATTVRLSWDAPSDVVAGALYTATARVGGSKQVLTARTAATSAVFTGIRPGSVLVPQVLDDARRSAGFADTGPSWTQPLASAAAPRHVLLSLVLPDGVPGLRVSWNPPASDGGTPITGYRVRVMRSGAEVSSGERTVPAGTRSVTFTDVDAGTAYLAAVVAVTAEGEGRTTGSNLVDTGSTPGPSTIGQAATDQGAGVAPVGDVATPAPTPGAASAPEVAAPRVQVAGPMVAAAASFPVLALLGSVFGILFAGAFAILLVVRRFGI